MVHNCDLGVIENSSCDIQLEFVGSLFISCKSSVGAVVRAVLAQW